MLIAIGAQLNIKSPHLCSYKIEYFTMDGHPRPCIYCVKPGKLNSNDGINFGDILKIGSTSDAHRRFSSYENMGGIILNDWGRYDENVLGVIDTHIRQCYSIVAESFEAEGGFQKWISRATIQECRDWERKAGGLSIYFVMWMEFVLNCNGMNKYGVYRNLHIRTIEMANQLHYGILGGAQFEQLHFEFWDSFIIPNHERVRKSTGMLMARIREELGSSTNLRFELHSASVSWEHGMNFNSREELTRKLDTLFEGRDIGGMGFDEMKDILGTAKVVTDDDDDDNDGEGNNLSVILENIDVSQLESVKDVLGLVELIFRAPDATQDKQLFSSATELFYDFLFDEVNSKMNGCWKDPYTDRPGTKNKYDASNLNHEKARENHINTIQDLKRTVDKCKDDGTVFVALMVSHLILLVASMTHCP